MATGDGNAKLGNEGTKPGDSEGGDEEMKPIPMEDSVGCIEILPMREYSEEALRKGMKEADTLAPKGTMQHQVSFLEKKALMDRYGFKDPRSLTCYSARSGYRDLVAYFDNANTVSDVNLVCTRAFKMYGLDGNQRGGDWNVIRGLCVVLRAPPPLNFVAGPDGKPVLGPRKFEFHPKVTIEEMVETLMFFKDKNAREVAKMRDVYRSFSDLPEHKRPRQGFKHRSNAKIGEVQSKDVVDKAFEKCAQCATPRAIVYKLYKCECQERMYCGRECQRKDWRVHKKTCKAREQAKARKATSGAEA